MTSRLALCGLALTACLAGTGVTSAQDDPQVDCATAVTQSDLNVCSDRDYEAADKALNATYRTVMAHMKEIDADLLENLPELAGAVDALKKAQRAWIGYRDSQCALSGFSARGGSMEPMLVSGCLADLTTKRTAELKEMLEAY